MLSRRHALAGAAAAAATTACTEFNTETGETSSCDIVTYDFNTGLQYGSSAFNPTFVNDGDGMPKWKFNNQTFGTGPNHHNRAPVVHGFDLNGIPALPNTKWMKATDQFQAPGDHFLFTYCFCVDDSEINNVALSQQFRIQDLHVKSSHQLHRVMLNQAILFGGSSGEKEFIYMRDPSHDAFFTEGLNCLHISLINDDPYPVPVDAALSVAGYVNGLSCCD